ncbi:MAG: hypothetical protein ACRDV7_00620 [Acidimicrobiia bacterium]
MTLVPTDPRTIAILVARARVVIGLIALVLPGVLARLMLGSSSAHARVMLRMVGIRDVALGVGAITSLKEQTQDAEWVSMGALSDGGDAVALLIAPTSFRRVTSGLVAAGASALGLALSRQLADERAASVSD